MTPLCDMAVRHRTDKCLPHNYTPKYFELLADRRDSVRNVLEIGIGKRGGSLRMWAEFFPRADVVGVDIESRYLVSEDRIRSVLCDQRDSVGLAEAVGLDRYDVIVDDGLHTGDSQISTMRTLLPFLRNDGVYFVEDIKKHPERIAARVPKEFVSEVYVGSKPLGSGFEMMLVVRRRCS